jgi:hypothetical protein
MGHPGNLERVQILRGSDSFNGLDGIVFGEGFHLSGAGAHYFAADDDGTRAALTVPASHFATRQEELLAQRFRQGGLTVNNKSARLSVNIECLFLHDLMLSYQQFIPVLKS